ncbi:MAG: hypothetical protein Q4P30_02580 [Eubacteriales bacterium]|nr:hypothetical protein [Eubacteriales bacterium]
MENERNGNGVPPTNGEPQAQPQMNNNPQGQPQMQANPQAQPQMYGNPQGQPQMNGYPQGQTRTYGTERERQAADLPDSFKQTTYRQTVDHNIHEAAKYDEMYDKPSITGRPMKRSAKPGSGVGLVLGIIALVVMVILAIVIFFVARGIIKKSKDAHGTQAIREQQAQVLIVPTPPHIV